MKKTLKRKNTKNEQLDRITFQSNVSWKNKKN